MGVNVERGLLLVLFVSVITLILSTNDAFAVLPVADAGPDQMVDEGVEITLSGAGTDADGTGITAFKWTYTSGAPPPSPFSGNPNTNESNDASFSYTPDLNGKPGNVVLKFSLVVTSGGEESVADEVIITIKSTNNKHNGKPDAAGKFNQNLGQIVTGKAFGINVDKPGAIVSGFVRNLVVQTTIDGAAVTLDFTQSDKVAPGLALPDILTALYLDLGFTGIDLSDESSLSSVAPPLIQFLINSNFESSGKFVDGCPVMSLQLLDETNGVWGAVGNPNTANTNKIYVSNSDVDTVSVIDGSTNDVVSTVTVGDVPKSLVFDQSANRVYVVNEGDNTVSVINTASDVNTIVGAPIAVGTTPSSVDVNESTDRLYVTNSGEGPPGTVSVIDTAGDVNTIVGAPIAVGTTPSSVVVNESNDRVYVTNSGSGTVSVIDVLGGSVNENTVIATIAVGASPSSVTVNESNDKVYVTNSGSGTVSVIDGLIGSGTVNTVIATITVGATPNGISYNAATEKLYVTNSGDGTVSIIDTTIDMVLTSPATGAGATDVDSNPNTNRIFVANSGAGTVSVIDGIVGSTTEDTVIDTITTGISSNFGIALNTAIPNPVRDPSADEKTGETIDRCAYIATPPHFSKFAVGGIKALALASLSGGGGADGAAPITSLSTLITNQNFDVPDEIATIVENHDSTTPLEPISTSKFTDFDLPLTINDNGYPLGGFSNTIETFSADTGKPVTITSLYYEQSTLQHVSMYLNLRGITTGDLSKSDTQIIYNKDKSLAVVDPNGFFESVSVNVIEDEDEDSIKKFAQFEIIFAKPMDTSDIVLRSWDDRLRSLDTIIYDAIEVVDQNAWMTGETGVLSLPESQTESILDPDPLDEAREELTESTVIPSWIKTSTGWWSDGSIGDDDFIKGIEHMIQNDIIIIPNLPEHDAETPRENIPDWIKNNAGWWANGQVSDNEFTQSLQWLIANGVIGI